MPNSRIQFSRYSASDTTRLTAVDVSYSNPLPIEDPAISAAIHQIHGTYGDIVSVHEKNKSLLKFGRSETVQTATKTTLMTLPSGIYNETYVADNLITHISSSSTADTQDIVIEGHTVDGNGDFTFSTQTIALVGQTKTVIPTPIARASRMYNNGSVDLVGDVYLYEDDTIAVGVPSTGAKVHCEIRAGENNSEKAATTISNQDYWIITDIYADVLEKTAANAEVILEIRRKDKVFREVLELSCSNTSGSYRSLSVYIIVPPNSDIRLRSLASGANTTVSGGINGVLAIVV